MHTQSPSTCWAFADPSLPGVYYVRVFAENDNVNSERGSAEPFPANGRVVGELPT